MNKLLIITIFVFVVLIAMTSCAKKPVEECFTDACLESLVDQDIDVNFTVEGNLKVNPAIITDNITGCQYVAIKDALTPRMDRDGTHVCAAPLKDPLTINHGE